MNDVNAIFGAALGRRRLLQVGAIAGGVVATGGLAACGTPSSGESGGASGAKVTLKVVGFRVNPEEIGSELDKSYQKFLADFQTAHPDIVIESLETPPDFDTQLVVDLAAGTAPDLWAQDASSLAALADRQLLLDMRKCIEADPALTTDRFFPSVLKIHERPGGELYGLPNDFTPVVTYFNPTLFDAAGIKQPASGWTWDDQLAAAQELTVDSAGRGPSQAGFDPSQIKTWGYRASKDAYLWVYRLWQNGTDVLDPENKQAKGYLDSDAAKQALQWYVDLVLKHKVAPSPTALDQMTQKSSFTAEFLAGRFGMFDSGHWSLVGFTGAENFKPELLSVAPMPKNKEEATVLYESSFCARHDLPAEKIKAVATFVNEATGARWQETKALTGIAIASNQKIAEESLTKDTTLFKDLDGVFIEAAKGGRPPKGSQLAKYPTVEKMLGQMMEAMLRSGDVEGEINKAVAAIDQELGA